MADFLRRLATGRNVIIAILLTAGLGFLVFTQGPYAAVRAAGGTPLPDERRWQPAELAPWLESLGESGRAAYRAFLIQDSAFMTLVATPAFLLLWVWVLARLFPARPRLALTSLVLLIPAIADLTENVVLRLAAGRYPDLAGLPLALAAGATALKSALAMVLHPLPLLAALVYLSMQAGRAIARR